MDTLRNRSLPRASLVRAVGLALALAVVPAFAQDAPDNQDTPADNDAEVTASVPADRIADRYADSLFDGDEELAADTVEQLREGGDVEIENPDGTTTVVESGPMGYGEVNIALGMAEKLVEGGEAEGWQDALYGTADTTDPDGTVVEGTAGILALRADGMGWGKIAQELGFKLGSVLGKAPTRDRTDGTATAAKTDRTSADRAAKPERGARPERADKPERVAKVDRPERVERPSRPERPERPQKPERGGRP